MFADVIPLTKINFSRNQVYTYSIPLTCAKCAKIGSIVKVGFGSRSLMGVILEIHNKIDNKNFFKYKIKPIEKIFDNSFSLNKKSLELVAKISYFFCSPLGVFLNIMIPKLVKPGTSIKNIPEFSIEKIEQKVPINITSQYTLIETDQIPEIIRGVIEDKSNGQVLLLVPEIFRGVYYFNFYKNIFKNITFIHSGLSRGEYYRQWMKIKTNQADLIISTRQGVFLPMDYVKKIVFDQAEDIGYKNYDQDPRYDSRIIAEMICEIYGSSVIKTFNSLPLNYCFSKNKYSNLALNDSKKNIHITNVCHTDCYNDNYLLSQKLIDLIHNKLKNNDKIIIYINKLGRFSLTYCPDCRYSFLCRECGNNLIYHQNNSLLKCSKCGYQENIPAICPQCGKANLKHRGIRADKIISDLKKIFPQKKVCFLNAEKNKRDNDILKNYFLYQKKEYDILITTQAVLKFTGFIKCDTMIIANFEQELNFPNYNTEENAYLLLLRLSSLARETVIPTREFEHRFYSSFKNNNFYQDQLSVRKEFNYPPYSNILKIIYKNKNLKKGESEILSIQKKFMLKFQKRKVLHIGRAEKINTNYVWTGMVKNVDQEVKKFFFQTNINLFFEINPIKIS